MTQLQPLPTKKQKQKENKTQPPTTLEVHFCKSKLHHGGAPTHDVRVLALW